MLSFFFLTSEGPFGVNGRASLRRKSEKDLGVVGRERGVDTVLGDSSPVFLINRGSPNAFKKEPLLFLVVGVGDALGEGLGEEEGAEEGLRGRSVSFLSAKGLEDSDSFGEE